jgi:hypothetical protein
VIFVVVKFLFYYSCLMLPFPRPQISPEGRLPLAWQHCSSEQTDCSIIIHVIGLEWIFVHPPNEQDALLTDYVQLAGKTAFIVLQERSRPAALHSLEHYRLCKILLSELRVYQKEPTSIEMV